MLTLTTKIDAHTAHEGETMNENLDTMRLPELWTLFAEVTGGPTRCPNRGWLVRRITEARAAQVGPVQAPDAPTPPKATTASPDTAPVTNVAPAADAALDDDAPIDLNAPPDWCDADQVAAGLMYHAAEDFGCEDDDEPAANSAQAATPTTELASTSAGDDDAIPDLDVATPELDTPKLTKMSVDELRLLYRRLIGRETGSTAKNYLVWKLRQAMKGKIKFGAVDRAPKVEADTANVLVLPLRMPRHEVEELDKVWHELKFPSRTAFLRRAITEYVGLRAVEG